MANLSLKNITKTFGETVAVSDINIDIKDGEFVTLVGPSGCGKSTVLRMIAGLETISQGEIFVEGALINDIAPKNRDIAMVFQNYALYPHMTVFQNMAFGLKMQRVPKIEIEDQVLDAAKILGLTDLLNRKSRELSGGQQQRVAVGRAIVRKPKLFLFDEPLSNLDAKLRVSMRAELIKLHKNLAATMIYVTHDQIEAMSMGDRVVVLKDGVMQQAGAPLEIYHNPANKFVAGFIGSPPMNFIPCSINLQDEKIILKNESFEIHLPAPENETKQKIEQYSDVILGIRPEHIIEPEYYHDDATGQTVSVFVEFMEAMGSEVLATCRLGKSEIIARLTPQTLIKTDETIQLVFDMKHAKLFDPATGEALV